MIGPGNIAHSHFSLFPGLTFAEFAQIASVMQQKSLPASAHLIIEETNGEITFIIQTGSVKITVLDPDGTEVILAILGPGEIVGEMSLLDSLDRMASVIAIEPTTVYIMCRCAFWVCLRSISTMTYNLARILSQRLRAANAYAQTLCTLDADGRIAQQIIVLASAYGERMRDGQVQIPLRLTQSDLAALVGASRVRVNQVLVTFRRQGYLSIEGQHRIVLNDLAGLSGRCHSRRRVPRSRNAFVVEHVNVK